MSKLEQALAFHTRGELAQAERLYREILEQIPSHFDALQLLGVVEAQKGNHAAAVGLIDLALRINPDHAASHNNRGNSLRALNRHDEALASFERAFALKPDYAEALYNRGAALHDLNRIEEALASYDRALALRPGYAEALGNRGNALQELKRYEEALASYDRALALQPDDAGVLYNRGNALWNLKRYEEALASYDRALALEPRHADALNNRGYALHSLRRFEEALASYDRALRLRPDFPAALNNRGNALQDLRRSEEAVASYDRALSLEPGYGDALENRANALRSLARYEDAVDAYARLLALDPDRHFALGKLLHARMACCDWRQFAPVSVSVEEEILAGKKSAAPFEYQAVASSARAFGLCAEVYAAATCPPVATPALPRVRHDTHRIRIGYVSGEFRRHATSRLMVELFERHDRNRFEVVAFDNGWDDASGLRVRIEKAFDEVVDIARLGDAEAVAAIQRKQIDILVDLNGHFGLGRQGVFSRKPAPVQVSYLGFPGTTGTKYIDYVLADAHVIPPGHEAFYTEKVVYLPDSYQVNDSTRRLAGRTPARADGMLPEAGFVFCCFNNNYKITPRVFDVWMRLLGRVPGSVLWLLEDNPAASRNLRLEAQQRGVAPERVVFAARRGHAEHLSRHRLADLFLDTLPCNAHTTAGDALWAGLPVLTCMGDTFAGRVAGSLLNAIGLPELITHSLEDYEELALKLATAPAMLSDIRSRLARNRATCPLFDTDRFRRHIEAAFASMWERYQRGEPPQSFTVAA